MNSIPRTFLFLLSLSTLVFAEDISLSAFKLGDHISGPEVDLSKMEGKVVVIDYWGTRCPPCIALMPHIAKLHKKYNEKGLVVIAAESQGSPVEKINALTEKNNMECTVVAGVRGPKLTSGLPYMAIFDVTGALVWKGRPGDDSDDEIKKQLKQVNVKSTPKKPAGGNLTSIRLWTNKDGKTMNAFLKEIQGESCVFMNTYGQQYNYEIAKLSDADQALISDLRGAQ